MTTMTDEVSASAPTQAQAILQRSVCLILSCGYLGNHRRVELGGMELREGDEKLEKEKGELGASKKLFANKDLKAARHAVDAIKHQLKAMSVDGGTRIFGDGTILLPLLSVSEAEVVIEHGRAVLALQVEKLVEQLPRLIEERKAQLGKLFRAGEYPTADEVRAAFRVTYRYISFAAPDQLQEVDAAAYARAVADNDARLASAYDDVIVGLRSSALLVMQELAERLRPSGDGKPKVLRGTALRDLQDLLQRLPVLNSIGQDESLADALARIRAVSQGLTVETLRDAPAVRAMLQKAAEETAATLGTLVSTASRGISF